MSSQPRVISTEEVGPSQTKWVTLNKIKWLDAEGKERLWECASRKTRGSSGIDAVAVFALIRSRTNSFPLSTVVIEQYRPPIDKFIIELPAGLIDGKETPEEAAIRELEEETGFKANRVIESTEVIVSDPGMTDANMKLVAVSVTVDGPLELPKPKLDEGESIVTKIVELEKLSTQLEEYERKGFVIDARLSHFNMGLKLAARIRDGDFA